jgi:hypothetical protein
MYASLSKLSINTEFREQMLQSPLLPALVIPFLSYAIPTVELLIVGLLFFDRVRIIGLYLSFFLMLSFTFYLIMLLNIDETLPCSCGGILGKMNYPTHIAFNIFFSMLSLIGIFLENRRPKIHA